MFALLGFGELRFDLGFRASRDFVARVVGFCLCGGRDEDRARCWGWALE